MTARSARTRRAEVSTQERALWSSAQGSSLSARGCFIVVLSERGAPLKDKRTDTVTRVILSGSPVDQLGDNAWYYSCPTLRL
jgi:hypothetical protein